MATFSPTFVKAAGSYSATISWGDGTSTAGTIVAAAGGGYAVQGTKVYPRFGDYATKVTINDPTSPINAAASAQGQVAVSDAPIATRVQPLSQTPGSGLVQGVIATVTTSNTQEVLPDLSASIDWGDGTTTPGTIAAGARRDDPGERVEAVRQSPDSSRSRSRSPAPEGRPAPIRRR